MASARWWSEKVELSPLRILVIAVLLYIGYRLIVGGRKKDREPKAGDSPGGGQPRSADLVQDVLVEDPVCHVLVPKKQAVRLHHHGTEVFFCSDKCCKIFLSRNDSDK
ncbi:MAG: YHS domain-containing protein [Desulfopila sp.]